MYKTELTVRSPLRGEGPRWALVPFKRKKKNKKKCKVMLPELV